MSDDTLVVDPSSLFEQEHERLTRAMEVERLADGVWQWRTPERDGRVATSVYVERGAAIVLVDPVVPTDPAEAERLWQALDRDVERAGQPPTIVLTSSDRQGSAEAIADRYGAPVLTTRRSAADR